MIRRIKMNVEKGSSSLCKSVTLPAAYGAPRFTNGRRGVIEQNPLVVWPVITDASIEKTLRDFKANVAFTFLLLLYYKHELALTLHRRSIVELRQ